MNHRSLRLRCRLGAGIAVIFPCGVLMGFHLPYRVDLLARGMVLLASGAGVAWWAFLSVTNSGHGVFQLWREALTWREPSGDD